MVHSLVPYLPTQIKIVIEDYIDEKDDWLERPKFYVATEVPKSCISSLLDSHSKLIYEDSSFGMAFTSKEEKQELYISPHKTLTAICPNGTYEPEFSKLKVRFIDDYYPPEWPEKGHWHVTPSDHQKLIHNILSDLSKITPHSIEAIKP